MIFKNFWAHRKQNGFIFAEITLIAILSFWVLDYCVLKVYDQYILSPDGEFEKEHLVIGYVSQITKNSDKKGTTTYSLSGPKIEEGNEAVAFAALRAYRDEIRKMPEVQSAGYVSSFIGNMGSKYDIITVSPEADSTRTCKAYHENYILNECFFETMGLTTIESSPLPEQLSKECPPEGIVITRSLAIQLFDTDDVIGRRIVCELNHAEVPIIHRTITGVLKDVKPNGQDRYCYIIFLPIEYYGSNRMLIRLKPDVKADHFVEKMNKPDLITEKVTNISNYSLLLDPITYKKSQKKYDPYGGSLIFVEIITGTFGLLFMLNVILGTLGTFWLQIRKRTGDFGIMRSFGAKRRHIFWAIWSEGALLTFFACLLGQLIWLQIALRFGLAKSDITVFSGREIDWTTQFWPHFFIVCGVQFLFILFIVTIGIITPSLIAMYRKPVNALRHE